MPTWGVLGSASDGRRFSLLTVLFSGVYKLNSTIRRRSVLFCKPSPNRPRTRKIRTGKARSPSIADRAEPYTRIGCAAGLHETFRAKHTCGAPGTLQEVSVPMTLGASRMVRDQSSRKHCLRRVYAGACETLKVVLTDRLHLGRRRPNAAKL